MEFLICTADVTTFQCILASFIPFYVLPGGSIDASQFKAELNKVCQKWESGCNFIFIYKQQFKVTCNCNDQALNPIVFSLHNIINQEHVMFNLYLFKTHPSRIFFCKWWNLPWSIPTNACNL